MIAANLPVENSKVIKRFYFDNTVKQLNVHFKNESVYMYTPVSEEFFNKLKQSTSKGSFFNKNIRDNQALTCYKLVK